jgi:hypothetical protein
MQTNIVDDYSLQNIENFYDNFTCSKEEIYEKYNTLFSGYFIFMFENLQVKNSSFLKFIIQRGLLTVTNVFNFILYYSKNLEMAYYHGQKAFYFYIEYIGQISEEHRTFLQLSSRDATMFVYKKTIFEIHNEFKKTIMDKDKSFIENLDNAQFILKVLIDNALENFNFKSTNKENEITYHLKSISHIFQNILYSKCEINIIKLFIERSATIEITNFELFYKRIDQFLKCYNDILQKKNLLTKESIKTNILYCDIKYFFEKDTKFSSLFSKEL